MRWDGWRSENFQKVGYGLCHSVVPQCISLVVVNGGWSPITPSEKYGVDTHNEVGCPTTPCIRVGGVAGGISSWSKRFESRGPAHVCARSGVAVENGADVAPQGLGAQLPTRNFFRERNALSLGVENDSHGGKPTRCPHFKLRCCWELAALAAAAAAAHA